MKINFPHLPARRLTARLTIALLVLLAFVGGCVSVGPDYVRPDTEVSPQWHTPLKGGLNASGTDPGVMASWWTTLNDETLSRLIERAVAGNLDLKRRGPG